jgi:hypothetical protein
MRTISGDLDTHLQGGLTTIAYCWIVKRQDAVIKRYTNHDRPIRLDLGDPLIDGTYNNGSMGAPNAIQIKSDMSVNNLDSQGFFIDNDIPELDVVSRIYDSAVIYTFFINWKTPSQGPLKMTRGTMGQIKKKGLTFTSEFRSFAQYLAMNMCALVTTTCRSQFGATGRGPSSGCRYPINPPTWTPSTAYALEPGGALNDVKPTTENGFQYRVQTAGTSAGGEPTWPTSVGATVSDGSVVWVAVRAATRSCTVAAAINTKQFKVTGLLGDLLDGTGGDSGAGFFAFGQAMFTGGELNHFSMRVLSFSADTGGTYLVTLRDPMPFLPEVGDALNLVQGCNQSFGVCKRLGNYKNFRAEPVVPGPDSLFRVHSANGSKK